jgi:hypothetical protein
MKLTTHLQLVLRLRMCGIIPPISPYACMAWCLAQGNVYFYMFMLLPSLRLLSNNADTVAFLEAEGKSGIMGE